MSRTRWQNLGSGLVAGAFVVGAGAIAEPTDDTSLRLERATTPTATDPVAAPRETDELAAPTLVRRTGELPLTTSLKFEYGHTAMRAAETSAHDRVTSGVAGAAANSGVDIDAYDASLRWDLVRRGDFSLSPRTGVRAVRSVTTTDRDGQSTSRADASETAASTFVGLSLRWDAAEALYLSAGVTSPMMISDRDDGPVVFEYTAEGGIRLHHNVGLFVGYQRLRSAVDAPGTDPSRTDEGVMYARFVLRF